MTDWIEWWDGPSAPAAAGGPLPSEGVLGTVLRDARERAVLSQKELATLTGITQSVISRMERGQRTNWSAFCRLLDAMELEPVVSARRRRSDLERQVERLAPLSAEDRLAVHQLVLEFPARHLPADGWAIAGDAALAAHGVPVTPAGFDIAVTEAVAATEWIRHLRDDWHSPFAFQVVEPLPPLVHVRAGDQLVPLLPLDAIDLGAEGTQERTDREAAMDAYLQTLGKARGSDT